MGEAGWLAEQGLCPLMSVCPGYQDESSQMLCVFYHIVSQNEALVTSCADFWNGPLISLLLSPTQYLWVHAFISNFSLLH